MTDPNVPATPPPAPAPANPYAAAAPAGKPTNVLAIIALIAAFVIAPAGIICGHIALGQIKKSGEGGHALALWGTILGYVFTVLWILIFLFSILVPLLILGSYGTVVSNIPGY
jgi:hypothetical protein